MENGNFRRIVDEMQDRARCQLCFAGGHTSISIDNLGSVCHSCFVAFNQVISMPLVYFPNVSGDQVTMVAQSVAESYLHCKEEYLDRLSNNVNELVKRERASLAQDALAARKVFEIRQKRLDDE